MNGKRAHLGLPSPTGPLRFIALSVFYLLNPEGSFVAIGRLTSDAADGRSAQGDGKYVADIAEVRMLPRSVARLEVVAHVPGWGWPRQPHTATTVPDEHVDELLNLLT